MRDDEQRDLRKLLSLLERVEAWGRLTDGQPQAWRVQAGSAFAGDDAKTDPYQVSHSAWHALTVATDHLQCLRSSLVRELTDKRASVHIHTHAQSSLIRGALENGARAVWLAAPATRLTRISRRLALEAAEVRHSSRLRQLVQQPAKRTAEDRLRQLTDLAMAAGLAPERVKKTLNAPGYGEIVRDAGERTTLGADIAEVVWSGCSALAHGDLYGTLGMLERDIVARDRSVAVTRVTGSISGLYWSAVSAVFMIDHGFGYYRQRAAAHH
ncbi:hypothetical protein [Planomonospora sphaerica]|uniref:hypothetical protein n=1 Tax=Planomonospora sphaerica TaxID=161355 RepID=UPI00128FCEC8|nr:hypothetical protein [Planomonospora sphaerica]